MHSAASNWPIEVLYVSMKSVIPLAIHAVKSHDGMTSNWDKLPYDLKEKLSHRIINEVKGVNRICFDIKRKPPGTIQWE